MHKQEVATGLMKQYLCLKKRVYQCNSLYVLRLSRVSDRWLVWLEKILAKTCAWMFCQPTHLQNRLSVKQLFDK